LSGPSRSNQRVLYAIAVVSVLAISPFMVWPVLSARLLATNFLPHQFCYLRNAGLIWTHVAADSLIGIAYFAISGTLAYLDYKARRDIPFHWMFLAFGLFIIACGGTHLMEVVTIWIPVYVFSAAVKIFTAVASITTAIVLPFTVPRVLTLVQQEKISQQVTAKLRASEERKEALLRKPSRFFATWKIAYIRWPSYIRACTAPRIWRASILPSMRKPLRKTSCQRMRGLRVRCS
jgi:hypothetical protein